MNITYILREDSLLREDVTPDTVVFRCMYSDYGLSSEDTANSGVEHTSVTRDPNGQYPFFTVPERSLELSVVTCGPNGDGTYSVTAPTSDGLHIFQITDQFPHRIDRNHTVRSEIDAATAAFGLQAYRILDKPNARNALLVIDPSARWIYCAPYFMFKEEKDAIFFQMMVG